MALQPGNFPEGINPFLCRSEGMRRLSIAGVVVGAMTWVAFVAIASGGFTKLNSTGWMIALGGPPAMYVAVMGIRLAVLWVVEGFKKR
jgi:hypothetical protein